MTSYLSEGDAWREVARRWVEREEWGQNGLCGVAYRMNYMGQISVSMYRQMMDRLDVYLDGILWAYPWTRGKPSVTYADRHREARALAALWLACDADAEAAR